ncbi:MAG: hypothetical protein R2788_21065 [Saprospiraceae bacterium]
MSLKTGSIQPVILDKVSGLEGYAFETHQVYSMQEDQSRNLWMGTPRVVAHPYFAGG